MTFRPTRRALGLPLGALALFVVGTNVQAGWVLTMAALVAGFWIAGLLLPLRALRGLEVERRTPTRVRAGDPMPVTVRMRNGARRPRGLIRVVDQFCGTGSAVVSVLAAGAETELRGRRTDVRRGIHTGGTCRLESGAPFGVLVARREVEVPARTIVVPRTFELRTQGAGDDGAVAVRQPAGDVSSVRGYRPGDPVRHIHWRSTARRGDLVVREFEEPEEGGRVIVGAAVPSAERVADAVASAACSYALDALAAGHEVLLLPADRDDPPTTPVDTAETILEWGARLGAGTPPLAESLARAPRTGAVICVLGAGTPTAEPADALRMYAAAGRDVLAVAVAEEHIDTHHTALKGAGVRVTQLTCEEIEIWCGIASAAS